MVELEKRTNIHVDWMHPAKGSEKEAYSLLIASGNLPDFLGEYGYTGGLEKAVDDGYYLKLNDYIEENMPNYTALRNDDPNVYRDTITDNGYIAGVYQVSLETPLPDMGIMIRKDWLDDLGLGIPVTYGDWAVMLDGFKNVKGADSPMLLGTNLDYYGSELSAGYGVGSTFYRVDGKVHYPLLEENYKTYIAMIADWYSKGYIQEDFYSNNIIQSAYTHGTTNRSGVVWLYPEIIGHYYAEQGRYADTNQNYVGVTSPKVNADDGPSNFRMATARTGATVFAISAGCGNPALLMRWLDYGYGEEGAILWTYGLEGESLEFIDGAPRYTDKVLYDPDVREAVAKWIYSVSAGPFLVYAKQYGARYDASRLKSGEPFGNHLLDCYTAYDTWAAASDKNMIPAAVSMSTEETNEYAAIFNDIDTYVQETLLKIVLGQQGMDVWDSMVEQIKSMNIDRAIELKQVALDRYLSR
jgi:putative aldouronate transport system substrate-binding protein